MNRISLLVSRAAALLMAAGTHLPPLSAQVEDAPVGVAVKIYARGQTSGSEDSNLQLSGTFLASSPTANDGWTMSAASALQGEYVMTALGVNGVVRVEPGKAYTIFVDSIYLENGEIHVKQKIPAADLEKRFPPRHDFTKESF